MVSSIKIELDDVRSTSDRKFGCYRQAVVSSIQLQFADDQIGVTEVSVGAGENDKRGGVRCADDETSIDYTAIDYAAHLESGACRATKPSSCQAKGHITCPFVDTADTGQCSQIGTSAIDGQGLASDRDSAGEFESRDVRATSGRAIHHGASIRGSQTSVIADPQASGVDSSGASVGIRRVKVQSAASVFDN